MKVKQNRKFLKKFYLYSKRNWAIYLLSFVETPREFIIAELSIRKLGSSLLKIRAYGSKALQ